MIFFLRITPRSGRWMAGGLVLLSLALNPSRGDEPAANGATPTDGAFRRIFVPAGEEGTWPVGRQRYLAVDPAEFERLYNAAAKTADDRSDPPVAQLRSAHYAAQLLGATLASGTARWELQGGASPTLLEIGACGLAMGDIRWKAASAEPWPSTTEEKPPPTAATPSQTPATAGDDSNEPAAADDDDMLLAPAATLGARANGNLAVLCTGSGEMAFSWSLAGQSDSSGAKRFELLVPRCLSSVLELDLPLDLTPSAEPGVVSAQGAAGEGMRRWRIEIGSAARTSIRIAPLEVLAERDRLVLVRETLNYDLSSSGLELAAEFELTVHYQPLKRVEVQIAPGLELTGARYGDAPLAWTVLPGGEPSGGRVAMELPEPLLGEGRRLRLSARGEVVRGARWRLPTVRPVGVFWQEGKAALRVGSPLTVSQLFTERCRQTGAAILPAPLVGESLEVQLFDAQAAIDLIMDRRRDLLDVATVVQAEPSTSLMTAQQTTDFRVASGEWLELTALIRDPWVIASVESVPAEIVSEWSIDKSAGDSRALRIRLAQALDASKSLRLQIRAESLRPPLNQPLVAGDLLPVRFQGVASLNEVISIESREGVGLRLANDVHLNRLDPSALDDRTASLFEARPTGLVFRNDDAAQALRLTLFNQPPRFTSEIRLRATGSATGLREAYRFRCLPNPERMNRLIVCFSQSRGTGLDWRWGGPRGEALEVRPLSAEQCALAGWPTQGEAWEVTLPQPQASQFDVYAERTTPWNGKSAVNLASLPEAGGERGTVELYATPEVDLDVRNARLRTQPAESLSDQDTATTRGVFRFDPAVDADPSSAPPLTLEARSAGEALPRAIVWSSLVDSTYAATGDARHTAVYRLQNNGVHQFRIKLPPGITVDDVWVNDRRVAREQATGELIVPLPDQPRFVVVTVVFKEPLPNWSRERYLAYPRLTLTDLAAPLDAHWQIRLPSGYRVTSSAGRKPDAVLSGAVVPEIARRLLGPFARGNAGLAHAQSESVRAASEAWLNALAATLAQRHAADKNSAATVGEMLAGVAVGDEKTPLVIDRVSLARAGITPHSRSNTRQRADRQQALDWLVEQGLALVCQSDRLVLTSQSWWAAHLSEIEIWHPLGWGSVGASQAARPSSQWLSIARWNGDAQLPWQRGPVVESRSAAQPAWQCYSLSANRPVGLTAAVTYVPQASFLAWIAGMGAFAAAISLASPLRRLAGGLLVVTAIALLAPAGWIPYASMLWLGAITGFVASLGWRTRGATESASTPDESSLKTASLVTGAMLAALLGAAPEPALAQPAPQPPTSRPPISQPVVPQPVARQSAMRPLPLGHEEFRVFVPADETGQPTGEDYQVPEELFLRLQRAARESAQSPQGYLLGSARYEGAVVRPQLGGSCRLDRLLATYQVDVLTAPARVVLPFSRARTDVLPGSVRLDGVATSITWNVDESAVEITIPQSGEHRLEMGLHPRGETSSELSRLELALPPIAESLLELELPENPPPVEVRGALGTVDRLNQGRLLRAALGNVNRVQLEWPEPAAAGANAAEVEELVWLTVQPGSVSVDLRLKYRISEERRVRIAADSRLRLLAGGGTPVGDLAPRAALGQTQILEFTATPTPAGEAVVSASFLLTGTSGVGNLRLPRFEPLAGRVVRRWLALSVNPALDYVESGANELTPVGVPDFLTAWGKTTLTPNVTYLVPSPDVTWSLGTQPRKTSTTAQIRQDIVVAASRAACRFEARLNTNSGYVFQHTLRVPANFEIQRISVLSENAERVARWARHEQTGLTVFLLGPTAGEHTLVVEGATPIEPDGRLPLPLLQMEKATLSQRKITVSRRPGVEVATTGLLGLAPDTDGDAPFAHDAGVRLVARWQADSEAAVGGTLTVTPNALQVTAIEVTALARGADGWQATFHAALAANEGILDELVLDIPPEWQGPFRCEPAAALQTLEAVAAGRRRLLVWPAEPVSGPKSFAVQGNLRPSAEHGLQAPRITINGVAQRRRFFVLPLENGPHQIDWETRGLKPAELPEEAGIVQPPHTAVFEALDDRGEAVLEGIDDEAPRLSVQLADYRLKVNRDGGSHGLALFDLEPAGQLTAPLSIPAECDVLGVFVDGAAAQLEKTPAGGMQVRLGPKPAPTRIQVLFRLRNESAVAGRDWRVAAPSLGTLAVQRTIWRVFAEPGERLILTGGELLTPLDYALIRVRSAAALMDVLGTLGEEEAPEEAVRNFRPWARRLRGARRNAERALSTAPALQAANVRAELRAIDEELERLAVRLGATEVLRQVNSEPLRIDQPGQLWEDATADREATVACLFEGNQVELAARRIEGLPGATLIRWGAAAGCLAMGVVLARRPRSLNSTARINAWLPWLALGALGVVWASGGVIPWFGGGLACAAVLGAWVARNAASRSHSTDFETGSGVSQAGQSHGS